MSRPFRSCGFIIFRRVLPNVEYLLMQASYGQHSWTPPKGFVDPGENDMQTAYRETREEAGLSKEDLKVYEDCKLELKYEVGGKMKTVIYWLAELLDKSKDVQMSREHQDYKWLRLAEACELSGFKDMQAALRSCDDYISKSVL
ncbi:unnamed protein product [Trichogramma brassicae]|uniref:Bis(5'-nucleosyl)-tetraphosphatase [asymmetrical] n=1 Tax=Trichogramma brassicae TaxID=86971 RepID=A0A6H5IN83_9HYME|nr:unnamed protein product [Trichogramma brassicae]